ncbi:OLC1v1036265C1 [Oldenlandia corymbosa var. corymbosa]|uniref:OLC1v1036265C1 n=1 Tax=Oldenlandia corymbosa var. corymbosa TaxID=529605 RepID=A0AAV1CUX8_OLDCO|nr:OLC1v1036265C1 [Oldenlandia corymbosa var. corymbosa]
MYPGPEKLTSAKPVDWRNLLIISARGQHGEKRKATALSIKKTTICRDGAYADGGTLGWVEAQKNSTIREGVRRWREQKVTLSSAAVIEPGVSHKKRCPPSLPKTVNSYSIVKGFTFIGTRGDDFFQAMVSFVESIIQQPFPEFDDGENKKLTLSSAAVIEPGVSHKKRCPPSLPKTVNSYSIVKGFTFIGTRGDDFVQAMVSFVESIIQQPFPEVNSYSIVKGFTFIGTRGDDFVQAMVSFVESIIQQPFPEFDDGENKKLTLSSAAVIEPGVSRKKRCPPSLPEMVNSYSIVKGFTFIGTRGDDFVQAMVSFVESIIEQPFPEVLYHFVYQNRFSKKAVLVIRRILWSYYQFDDGENKKVTLSSAAVIEPGVSRKKRCPPSLPKRVNSYSIVKGFTFIGTRGDDFVQAMVSLVESIIQQPFPEVLYHFVYQNRFSKKAVLVIRRILWSYYHFDDGENKKLTLSSAAVIEPGVSRKKRCPPSLPKTVNSYSIVKGFTFIGTKGDDFVQAMVNSYSIVKGFTFIGTRGDDFVQAMVSFVESIIQQPFPEFDDGENKKLTLSSAAVIEPGVSRKKRCPPSLPKTVNSYSIVKGFTFIGTRGDDFFQAMVSFVESIIQQPFPEVNSYSIVKGFTFIGTRGDDFVQAMVSFVESIIQQPFPEELYHFVYQNRFSKKAVLVIRRILWSYYQFDDGENKKVTLSSAAVIELGVSRKKRCPPSLLKTVNSYSIVKGFTFIGTRGDDFFQAMVSFVESIIQQPFPEVNSYSIVKGFTFIGTKEDDFVQAMVSFAESIIQQPFPEVNSYSIVKGFTFIGTRGDDFVQAMVSFVESIIQQSFPEVNSYSIVKGFTFIGTRGDDFVQAMVNSYSIVKGFTFIGTRGDDFVQAMVSFVESIIQQPFHKVNSYSIVKGFTFIGTKGDDFVQAMVSFAESIIQQPFPEVNLYSIVKGFTFIGTRGDDFVQAMFNDGENKKVTLSSAVVIEPGVSRKKRCPPSLPKTVNSYSIVKGFTFIGTRGDDFVQAMVSFVESIIQQPFPEVLFHFVYQNRFSKKAVLVIRRILWSYYQFDDGENKKVTLSSAAVIEPGVSCKKRCPPSLPKTVNSYSIVKGFTFIGTKGDDFVQAMVSFVESIIQQPFPEFDDGENKKVTLSSAAVIEPGVSRKKRCPPSLPKMVNSYSIVKGFTFIGTRGDDFVQAMQQMKMFMVRASQMEDADCKKIF